MDAIRLTLLGGFQVLGPSDEPVQISVKKAKALLAYLALHPGQAQPRDKLATLLWEESSDTQARHSLRQALVCLRKCLPTVDDLLLADGDSVTLVPRRIGADVFEFDQFAAARSPESLEQAVALYRGEFLEGFNARSMAFEDWLMAERSRLRESAAEIMARLLAEYRATGAVEAAVRLAIRLLSLDPLQESVHRALMELYARQGRYGAALKQYRICRGLMQRELGVTPEPETERLYARIMEQRHVQPSHPAANADADAMAPATAPARPPPELRHATVLFAELIGAFGTDGMQDPRDMHVLLERYFGLIDAEVRRYGGRIIKHFGETVVAVFGIPEARGNDAERAVRAASGIHRDAGALVAQIPEAGVRIGVASGRVMAGRGPDANTGYTVAGEALNNAMRVADHARPGETLTTDAVYQSIRNRATAVPMDESSAKKLWRLTALSSTTADQTAFVGRSMELRQFAGAIAACAETGYGQSFLIRGEAGIGKSRLLHELMALANERGFVCHTALVLDFGSGTDNEAVYTLARKLLGLPEACGAEQRLAAVRQLLDRQWLARDRAVFLHDLLALPLPGELRSVYDAMDSHARQRGRQEVLCRLIEKTAARQPLLLAVEDIHWADAMTLSVLAGIAADLTDYPAILVMTSRVEGEPLDPAWRGAMQGAPLITIDLGPLRTEDALALAQQILGDDNERARGHVRRAGGHPLFLEQLLRNDAVTSEAIPDSIQSIVWSRLDRLMPSDKYAVQAASVMGQRFSLEALQHLIDDPEYRCDALIAQWLVRPEHEGFLVTHALIRDSIYASLLPAQRQRLHGRAAQWFADRDPVLYAEHLDRGGDPDAARAYLAAARTQMAGYHDERALQLIERGLVLAQMPEIQYALNACQGEILYQTGAIDASIKAFETALDSAADELGRCHAWTGLAAGLIVKDRHREALEALDHAARVADGIACTEELSRIHYHRGNILFPLGQLDQCLQQHTLALRYAREAASPFDEARALSGLGDAYYQRGRIKTAHEYYDRCVELCRSNGFGRVEAINLAMRGGTRFYQSRLAEALSDVRAAADMAARVDNKRDECVARNLLGLMLPFAGLWQDAFAQAQKALALSRALGAVRFEAENLCNLALALIALDQPEEAEDLTKAAFTLSQISGPAYCSAWVLAVKAFATTDREKSREALRRGEALLGEDSVSHNYIHYYQIAIDVALRHCDWSDVLRYADALEAYTRNEPVALVDFFIVRARTLAALGCGPRDAETTEALENLRRQAEEVGLYANLPA